MKNRRIGVLLIEDNPGDARMVQEMLAEAGDTAFDLVCVDRLSTGLERLAEGGMDVVLLDLGLPDSSGLETFTKVYAEAPNMPIVILTSLDDMELAVKAVREGAQDCVAKNQVYGNLLTHSMRYAIERKIVEARIERLCSVIRAIKDVNRSFAREMDRESLLQKTCEALTEARGYNAVWLGFLKDDKAFATVKGCGFPDDVSRFRERVLAGDHPPCIKAALVRRDLFEVVDKSKECGDCFFKDACSHKEAAIIRVERADRLFGLLAVSFAPGVAADEEEVALLNGVAGDIAFALHNIEVVEARKQAEDERRSLERQMQHAQKLESLGVLAGGIAHDFNNLLMAVMGNADLALKKLSPVAPARDNISEIQKASQRAADLCAQMLAYSGKGKFVVQSLNLSQVVEEMSHMLEICVSKSVVLKYDFADNLPPVKADATQIRQVIMNLITNASEAIGNRSGVVSITTGVMDCDNAYLSQAFHESGLPEGTYVFLEVADTGCGMDEKTQAKLFDPFFTTKFTGRGLGLAAVLGIVHGHKGAIKVYSEPGKGTTFKVLLPACAESVDDHGQRTTDHRQESEWQGSGTVLFADDEEEVRAVGKAMLEDLGFTVLAVRDGREAVDVYREHADEIACVILDLTMPHMGGEECFREMRRIRKDVRVIMSSGYNELDVTQRFAGKGLAGFIQKPYLMGELEAKLREVLASS